MCEDRRSNSPGPGGISERDRKLPCGSPDIDRWAAADTGSWGGVLIKCVMTILCIDPPPRQGAEPQTVP